MAISALLEAFRDMCYMQPINARTADLGTIDACGELFETLSFELFTLRNYSNSQANVPFL